MTIETVEDCTDIYPHLYEGSVMSVVEETKRYYKALFCSPFGSYTVIIPKNRCVIK